MFSLTGPDQKESLKKYRRVVKALGSSTAASSRMPRIVARNPYNFFRGRDEWFASILLSRHVEADGTVQVLALTGMANGYRSSGGGFFGIPREWSEWPHMSSMSIKISDVRLLAEPDTKYEATLRALDTYFNGGMRDDKTLRGLLGEVGWNFNNGRLPSKPPKDARPLQLPPFSPLQKLVREMSLPEGFII